MAGRNLVPPFQFASPPLFITATDTGVGKTFITALIALKLREFGFSVGVCKPFASGCTWQNGDWVSEDAVFLKTALDLPESLAQIAPIRLEKPLAPLAAARLDGISTRDFAATARAAIENLRARYDCVLVEGVGGVSVPVGETDGEIWTIGDFARDLGAASVVVARRTLGTINHTLLTVKTAPDVRALVFNDAALVAADDLAVHGSVALVREIVGLPVWGEVPFSDEKNAATLEKMAARLGIEVSTLI